MGLFPASLFAVLGLLLAAYAVPVQLAILIGSACGVALLLPRQIKRQAIGASLICILAVLYFQGYDYLHRSQLFELAEVEETIWVSGVIDSVVKRDGDQVRFFLLVEKWGEQPDQLATLGRSERIVIRVKLTKEEQLSEVSSWFEGKVVRAKIDTTVPESARNPYAFDYRRYLRWQAVYVVGESSFTDLIVEGKGGTLVTLFQRWQMAIAAELDRTFTNPDVSGYMKSLLLGIQGGVLPEQEEMYADLGLVHVLAISGLHVTLVSGFFLWGFSRLGIFRERALLLTIALIVLYVLLVGASASAVRSGLMGGIGIGVLYLRKHTRTREVWAFSLMLMLVYNPYQLWHIGFQLSFAVTLGLLIYVPILQQLPISKREWVRSLVGVTVSAQLVSFPFLIYWFHQFSPISWLVNLLAVPALSYIILPLGYFALILHAIHPALGLIPSFCASKLLELIHQPLFFLQETIVPFSHWSHPSGSWLAAYAIFLFAVPILWYFGYQRLRDVVGYIVFFLLLLILARQPVFGPEEVRITFLDVGQGDSIVVEVGKKTVYLIDGGGTIRFSQKEPWREKRDPYEVGKDVVLPFLRARGIERIDRLVMSHGDNDHVGGLAAVVPRFSIGAVLVNGLRPAGVQAQLLQQVEQRDVPILTGRPDLHWNDTPEVSWTWMHPLPGTQEKDNDASVVLRLTAYGKTILFTGDIEQAGENAIVESGLLTSVDVLKVAHHGSRTSTSPSYLQRINPVAAVISVGQNNRYGHPSPLVIKRLQDNGAAVYRTDLHGAITLLISPGGLVWKTEITDT